MHGYQVPGVAAILLALMAASIVVARQAGQADVVAARARDLHTRAIVVDTHDDTTQQLLFDKSFDTDALLKKGYSEQDITKILGGNLLRVMQQVEAARGR